MIKNYLLTAWRHIISNRLFSVINIFGLSVGLMSCILILIYVRDEISYDKWITDGDSVVRMHTAYYSPDRPPFLTIRAAGKMMEAIRDFAPEQVESGVRLLQVGTTIINDDNVFNESVMFADGSFFELFDLPYLYGSPETSFEKPLDLVITEEVAQKYFGRLDVVGESLTVCCLQGEQFDVQVTGVIRNLPENTHLDIDFLAFLEPSMFDFAPNMLNTWTSVNTYTYFKLKPGSTAESLKQRIDYWLDNESPLREMVPEDVIPSEMLKLKFMAMPDLHLYARIDAGNLGDMKPLGDINMVYTFVGIAMLILLIASVNFMNLSTARASSRAREVALRKVMGATRAQVAFQFLGEAIAVAVLSLLFALVAVELVLPFYNEAIDRELTLVLIDDLPLLLSLLAVAVLVGVISGSYPAVYLSRFLPARILNSNQSSESGGQGNIRSLLVVFQFAVSIGLAVCTVVIYAQTLYARNMDVGYSYDNKMILNGLGSSSARDQQEAILNELATIPGVKSVVLSSEAPSQDNENNTGFRLLDGSGTGISDGVILNYYTTGYGFFESYNMKLLAGRTFDEQFGTDAIQAIPDDEDRIGNASIVINESAVRRLGLNSPDEAIGKILRADVFQAGTHDLKIVGVSEDVYFRSIKFGIRPSVFFNDPGRVRIATISFETDDIPQLVSNVEKVWKKMMPMSPVSHQFLNDMIRAQYQDEENQAKLFAVFATLAVVIACLGLYGLASFTAERRTKEIGIRKVMGARVRDIVTLLVWQFSIPVLIANVIAWPTSWFLMSGWLEGFSYRIDSSYILGASIVAGAGALIIAWLTVASRAIKVAGANPVNALRYE
ncbi:MAG: ABC transporter permease [Gammaproteobacteria bacterium]|nr:ABC transporter permease [Gammaproteobacteria bacterium]